MTSPDSPLRATTFFRREPSTGFIDFMSALTSGRFTATGLVAHSQYLPWLWGGLGWILSLLLVFKALRTSLPRLVPQTAVLMHAYSSRATAVLEVKFQSWSVLTAIPPSCCTEVHRLSPSANSSAQGGKTTLLFHPTSPSSLEAQYGSI